MHVIGGSGTGKSKFLESIIHGDLREGHGLCLIDWHGSLFRDVLTYCQHFNIGLPHFGVSDFRSVILLDPSHPNFITGFNPFMNRGDDISTQVSKRIDATVKPWGATNTNETPTFARLARVLYTFMAEAGETLPNAATLLEFDRRELRDFAITKVSDNWVKAQWRSLQDVKTAREWREQVLSTDNRLARFVGSAGIRRFMGMEQNNIDLLDIMDSGKILLVNLGSSGFLDREAARVFASLFLNEFFDAAMQRANRSEVSGQDPNRYILYLDEFQEYITDDIAAMLDQVRKGGLHIVLAHQHMGHFAENPKLKKSIFTNARIRAVFGGLDYEDACVMGNEMFLPDLNTRQIEKAIYHTVHVYEKQYETIRSRSRSHATSTAEGISSGSGDSSGSSHSSVHGSSLAVSGPGLGSPIQVEGWSTTETRGTSDSLSTSYSDASSAFSAVSHSTSQSHAETEGETVVPVWVPMPIQELGSEAEASRETKLSRVAQLLKEQMQQHCFIKLGTEITQPLLVPFVKDYGLSEQTLLEYQREVYKQQGALPAADVDRLLETSHRKFLAAASQTIDVSPRDEFGTSQALPQKATRKETSEERQIWNRTGPAHSPSGAQPPEQPRPQGERGPRTDFENHAKVARIVKAYGDAWTSDDNLRDICDNLDREVVPVPKTWPTLRDHPARTWVRALEWHKDLVKKAIRYASEKAKSTNP